MLAAIINISQKAINFNSAIPASTREQDLK